MKEILCVIPDTVEMNRRVFRDYLRRNATAKRFGFSKKHTEDINKQREEGCIPHNLYNLPVEWNTNETYLAK